MNQEKFIKLIKIILWNRHATYFHIIIMDSHQPQKVTLIQLQRFLPLRPPSCQNKLPQAVERYLGSPTFNNISLKDQRIAKKQYELAYRSYYAPSQIIEHLQQITGKKFSDQSIYQVLRNSAMKFGLVNWYRFVLVVTNQLPIKKITNKEEAAKCIQRKYRDYVVKKKIQNAYQCVNTLRMSLEERLRLEFQKQVLKQLTQHVERNRIKCQQTLKSISAKQMNYLQFEKVIQSLQAGLDQKKTQYLFMKFENIRRKANIEELCSELLPERKAVAVETSASFLQPGQELITFVRNYMIQLYYSWQDMVEDFKANYHDGTDELKVSGIYTFLIDKCENKISWIQASQIKHNLQTLDNIKYLYQRANVAQLTLQVARFIEKKARKAKLHVQNEVFYHFRTIIMFLVSRSKAEKLIRQDFNSFVVDYDTKLKKEAFYAVWRVYGDLINVKRIKQQCGVGPLACHFMLTRSPERYETIVEDLIDAMPPNTEVPYSKVEERINLNLEFILDSLQIRPLPLDNNDFIDYRTAIKKIFPLEFDLILRAYIFRKVAEKFIVLWRSVRANKKREKAINEVIMGMIVVPQDGKRKKSIDLKAMKPQTSSPTKQVARQKKISELKPEAYSSVKDILDSILDTLVLKEQQKEQEPSAFKKQITLPNSKHYTFRSGITRVDFHWLLGAVAFSRQFLTMKQGHLNTLKLKLPYRPGIVPVDFAIWGNTLAVLTSLYSLQLYALGQSESYPQRTIQLSKQQISQKLYDSITNDRLHRQLPKLLRPEGQKLIISSLYSNELILVDEDPTVPLSSIKLTFKQHFFNNVAKKIIPYISKMDHQDRLNFVTTTTQGLKQQKTRVNTLPQIKNTTQLKISDYEWKQWWKWLQELKYAARFVLQWQLKVNKKIVVSAQISNLLKAIREHMSEHNISINELIQDIGYTDGILNAKDVKIYLSKVIGLDNFSSSDGWMHELGLGKQIEYRQLANIVAYQWKYSPLEQPYLIISSFIMLPNLPILAYTLQNFPHIFLRNTETKELIAVLTGHSKTPIIQLIPEQMIIVSTESQSQKGKGQELLIWRLFEDIFEKYSEHPPWKIYPYITVNTAHEAAITSIAYSSRCNSIITASLDGSLKFWEIESGNPIKLLEAKRIYAEQSHFLHVATHSIMVGNGQVPVQALITLRIGQQISLTNAYPFDTTIESSFIQPMTAKVAGKLGPLPTPLRLIEKMGIEGSRRGAKKKALLGRWEREEMQKIGKGLLALRSLDLNFYTSLKAAYIFSNKSQLQKLVKFIKNKKYAEMVVRKVCEEYGLQLLQDLPCSSLDTVPLLPVQSNSSVMLQPIQLCEDSYQEVMNQLSAKATKAGLIEEQVILQIVGPHLYGDLEEKFKDMLRNIPRSSNPSMVSVHKNKQASPAVLHQLSELKKIIRVIPLQGTQQKFYSALRILQRLLRKTKTPLWELFSSSLNDLDKSKRIRTVEFIQKVKNVGLSQDKIEAITSYLSHSNSINMFELLHFARAAVEASNPSQMLSNYSSIILAQSVMMEQTKSLYKSAQKQQSPPKEQQKSLHIEVKEMLMQRSSKISQADSLRSSQIKKQEEEAAQLRHSTSQTSLSSRGKDQLQKKANIVLNKLRQLLKNESKSLWDIVSVACSSFVREPILSETEYFAVFQGLRTPLRLVDKLDLLKYLKREGDGKCSLNIFIDIIEPSAKRKLQGQKYLLLHLLDVLESKYSNILQEALQLAFFSENAEISSEQYLKIISQTPFNCAQFGVNEWELLLKEQKLVRFGEKQLQSLLYSIVDKHRLNIEFNKLGFVRALLNLIEQKNQTLVKIFPKTSKADFEYFKNCAEILESQSNIEEDFRSLSFSLGQGKNGLQARLNWDQMIKEVEKRIGKARQEESFESEAVRRLGKSLQSRRMSPFEFFVSMDRNRKYFITQEQLQAGLVELGVTYDLWTDIPKRFSKRLSYYSFLSYLVKKRVLAYKSVDSHLQTAMQRFQRRFLRQGDLETSFRRLAGQSTQVYYRQFLEAVRRVDISQQHARLLFGLLVNDKVVWGKRWGNDEALNDPNNFNRTFNFKRFAEVMLKFRTDNLTKTVAFRFYDYFKKRSISLVFQFRKWLDNNRKIKEVGEAIKKNSFVLPNDIFIMFLNNLHTGFSQQQLKDLINNKNSLEVDFHAFVAQLEDVYKRAHSKIDRQEVETYLQMMVAKMEKLKVGLPRLLKDFADAKGRLGLAQLTSMTEWLGVGLTKIQLRKIVTVLDTEKDGRFKMDALAEAVEQASQKMQRDQQDFRFDYIIEKLMNNGQKFVLKPSKLTFTLQRATIIFENLLTIDQSQLLFNEALKELKKQNISEKEMQDYVTKKVDQMKKRTNKKDKETALKILSMISRLGIDIDNTFSYLARHSSKDILNKQQFLLLYQSLELKVDLNQIASLFSYLEEKPGSGLTRSKWEEKLSMIKMEYQQQLEGSVEELRLFYKVKVYLAEVYLLFVRKAYKSTQIYHFFDKHSNGFISPDDLMSSLHQLGTPPEQDLTPKLMNYLDRNRDNKLSVSLLLNQLENCIGSKMRMILSTRTSLLFREKSKLFAQQSQKFISELASKQELIIEGDNIKSIISEADFITLLNQFGCRLKDDEVQDIRRNFQLKEGQLLLYPIYQSFMSLFHGSLQLPTDQLELYRRLMGALVSKNFTLGNVLQATTSRQLISFIDQLGIFTPIEVKLIVEANLYQGSKAVDHDLLKNRLRDAHLTQEDQMLSNSLVQMVDSSLENIQKELIQTIDPTMWKQLSGMRQSKITLDKFQQCLWESGVWVTKGIAKRYFNSFADGQYLDMPKLLKVCQKSKIKTERDWEIEQSQCQDEAILEKRQEMVKNLTERGSIRIAEHIIRSINFKDVSLEDELNCYYTDNYGFIMYQNLLDFIAKTGLDLKLYEKDIRQFIDQYCLKHIHSTFDPKHPPILEVKLLEQTLSIAYDIYRPLHSENRRCEKVYCEQLEQWRSSLKDFSQNISMWLIQRGIGQFKYQHVYRYLFQQYPKQRYLLPFLIKTVPKHISTYPAFCSWIINPELPNLPLNSPHMSPQLSHQSSPDASPQLSPRKASEGSSPRRVLQYLRRGQQSDYLRQFMRRDPVQTYRLAIRQFTSIDIPQPTSNIGRLAATLFMKYLLKNKHLLQINPLLIVPQNQPKAQPIQINHPSFNYNVKTLNSLVIQQESPLDDNGLLMVNKKWLAFPLERKYEFQTMATVAHLLHPTSLFIRSKNLYLWQPTLPQMPNNALSYRWNLIPVLARKILDQMAATHKAGFCLPHLRWEHLGQANLIDCPLYPCPIDKSGTIKLKVGFNTLNFEDSYCPPEFYNVYDGDNLNAKCDSWIFGCILYEFIYGHKPLSFLSQLQKYIIQREPGFGLSQVLAMQQLPAQFEYTFFDSHKLNRLFALEHYLNPKNQFICFEELIKRQQSMGAILFPLQVLYEQQLPFYKPQFKVMAEMNSLIWQCLSIKPVSRPTIEQILTKPIFSQQQPLNNYIQTLSKHPDAISFYQSSMEPFFMAIKNRGNIKNACLECLTKLIKKEEYLIGNIKVASKLVIPKQYPWPLKAQGSFTSQLLAKKQIIRQSSNLTLVTLLFQSRFLEYSLLLGLSEPVIIDQVLTVIALIVPSLKNYDSPFSAFVPHILDFLLRIIYQSPTGFISQHRSVFESDEYIEKWAAQNIRKISKGKYFKRQQFEGPQMTRCLSLLKELVLLTGQGNSLYLPVFHYLQEFSQTKLLFEVVFNHISLFKGPIQLNIQYFIDTLNDSEKKKAQTRCRVEVDMMAFLSSQGQPKRLSLTYFKDLLFMSSQIPLLYEYPPLFLQLTAMLRHPMQELFNKSTILGIITLCLQNQMFKVLKFPSANLLHQVIRLMIQPPRNTGAHQQYEQLRNQLRDVAELIQKNPSLLRELQLENETVPSIFESILSGRSQQLQLRSYPMLRSQVI